MISRSVYSPLRYGVRAVVAALLVMSLGASVVYAQPDIDVLAQYQARRLHALAIKDELGQRSANFQRQIVDSENESKELQLQLADALRKERETGDVAIRLEAEIAGKDDYLQQARGRIADLQEQQRDLQAKIEQARRDEPRRQAMCAIPFYGWIKCLDDLVKGWDRELERMSRDLTVAESRIASTEQERQVAYAQLLQLRISMESNASERAQLQVRIRDAEQRLVTIHAALAESYTSLQRYSASLDGFSAELNLAESLETGERASVIARRLSRLGEQLNTEMGRACLLLASGGEPLPSPLTQACPRG